MEITEDGIQPWWGCFLRPSVSQVDDMRDCKGATRFLYGDGSHPACSNIEWDSPPRNVTQPSSPEPRESKPAVSQSILYKTLTSSNTKQENDEKFMISIQSSSSITYNIYKNPIVNYVSSKKEQYACKLCNAVMTRKSNLKRHLKSMHTKCEDLKPCCGLKFTSKYKAQEHYYSVHRNFGYKCVYCTKVFSRASLVRHLTVHTRLRPYKCRECGRRSGYKGNIVRHMLKEHHVKMKFSQVESCSNDSLTADADVDWSAQSKMKFSKEECCSNDSLTAHADVDWSAQSKMKFSKVESCSNDSLTAHADVDWSAHSNMDWTIVETNNDSQVDSNQGGLTYFLHKKFRGYKFLS